MGKRNAVPALMDILEAIERIRHVTQETSLEAFEKDWQKKWIVERGVEII